MVDSLGTAVKLAVGTRKRLRTAKIQALGRRSLSRTSSASASRSIGQGSPEILHAATPGMAVPVIEEAEGYAYSRALARLTGLHPRTAEEPMIGRWSFRLSMVAIALSLAGTANATGVCEWDLGGGDA